MRGLEITISTTPPHQLSTFHPWNVLPNRLFHTPLNYTHWPFLAIPSLSQKAPYEAIFHSDSTAPYRMAASLPVIKILLITDSSLITTTETMMISHIKLSTNEVHKGSKIGRLWRFAHRYRSENSFDLIYILRGICDVTTKQHIAGRKVYWPPVHRGPLGMSILHTLTQNYALYLK